MLGLIGKKVGMTQIYREDGSVVPVTVVQVTPNVVVSVKTKDTHGYSAVELAFGEQKESRLTKPALGRYKKINVKPHRVSAEFRTDRAQEYTVGTQILAEHLQAGQIIDVQGRSKGKGFQGVIKMHHFSGGNDSHGNSVSHRRPGATGQRTSPGRTIAGKKLPKHMGDQNVTIKNLEVVGIETEQHLVLVRGAIPGCKTGQIFLYPHSNDFEGKVLTSQKEQKDKKAPAAQTETQTA